jgi:uncharacterized protein
MTSIVDKRKSMKNAESGNRKRFLERCKEGLRKIIDDEVRDKSIKDIGKKDIKVRDKSGVLDEPSFHNDPSTGNAPGVKGNNRRYKKGDRIPSGGGSAGGTKKASDQMKEFSYTLSKKEFLDILFEDMELPNYIKESLTSDKKWRLKRAGVGPDGPIVRLNLLKTMMTSIGRKFAAKGAVVEGEERKKPPFITEEDLRFNIYTKRPIFIRHAVMFAVMDISGSMGEHEKQLSKRFFLLLYLFLERQYESVDIVWIMHDTEAHEVMEEVFFSETSGGGTLVSSAYEMVNSIINSRYDVSKTNIYMAQASDGDSFEEDAELIAYLDKNIVPKVQYLAYLQVLDARNWRGLLLNTGLLEMFHGAFSTVKKVGYGAATSIDGVFPVLKQLFQKGREE